MRVNARNAVLAVVLSVLAGCAGEQQAERSDDAMDQAPMAQMAMPDTTAAAVWAYLEEANYRRWAMWPGKSALYTGGEPHGMLLTTYLNPTALTALEGSATALPAGAIIVKENYMPDSTLAAVTVMYKTETFNPEHNNWFFIKRLADGTVQVGGRGEGCQNCHGARRDNDYIMTSNLN